MGPRIGTHTVVALAFATLGIFTTAHVASAQQGGGQGPPPQGQGQGQPPPPQGGQGGQQPQGGGGPAVATTLPNDPPNIKLDAQRTAVALARKTRLLLRLGAFDAVAADRMAVFLGQQALATGADRDAALAELTAIQPQLSGSFQALGDDGVAVQPEVQQALSPIPQTNLDSLRNGQGLGIDGEFYLRAFDSLLFRNGRSPGQATPPNPTSMAPALSEAAAAVAAAGAPTGPSSTSAQGPGSPGGAPPTSAFVTTTAPSSAAATTSSSNSTLPIIVAIVIALLAVLGAGIALTRRRKPQGSAPIDELLEVSRRLTNAAGSGEIDRAVVREAIGLVNASAGGLVRRDDSGLVVAFESQADLFVPDRLSDGLIARVAETGQPITQISASEPAIRNLPASLAAVPLVVGGRVEAVLVVVNRDTAPFATADRELLVSLAPVTAAALHSASQAKAAVENSLLDPLTGIGNRRRLDDELPEVLATAARENRPVAFIMIDLDHFKAVNDTHGHPAGDAILRGVAHVVRDTVRPGDRVYRYGGEEFCVLLPDSGADEASVVAERVRAAVSNEAFDVGGAEPLRATASFGVSVANDRDEKGLVARADAALYEAKQSGRDRVATAASPTSPPAPTG